MPKNDNITYLTEWAQRIDGGGGGGDNGSMDARVAKLEALTEKNGERLGAIETRLVRIEVKMDQHSTKEELAALRGDMKASIAEAKNSIIMWVVSAILLAQLLPALLKRIGM